MRTFPDEVIKAGFIKGLRDAGFRIPDDPAHMHVVLRRNRESFHRYLLTRPGELHLRPAHQSPLENLCLAGAWVRNEFALPCVDAAAEGAIKVAGLIAARVLAAPKECGRCGRFAIDAPKRATRAAAAVPLPALHGLVLHSGCESRAFGRSDLSRSETVPRA